MCSDEIERAAHVLNVAEFTEFIDDFGRGSACLSKPDGFESVANSERARNIDPVLIEKPQFSWLRKNHRRIFRLVRSQQE
jgi:hypothetical protein